MDGAFLDRNSSTPLHVQLAERLRQLIISGEYQPGDRLSPEKELVDRFGLSRVTVRNGLAVLEREGWILKRQGLGTFVRNPIEENLTSVQTVSEAARAHGITTETRLLSFGPVVPPKQVAKALGRPANQALLRIEKLHVDDVSPIALTHSFVPLEVLPEAEIIRSQPGVPMIAIWERRLGVRVKGAQHHFRAEPADAKTAQALDLDVDAPVLAVDRVIYSDDGRAIEFVATFYRWNRYQFSIVLPRLRITDLR
ncbi:MAG: GntR family transcriptional regulator [Xanthobacteraceae bacterium]